MKDRLFNKTAALSRFILRQERIRIPIWFIILLLLTTAIAISFTDIYPTELERQAMAATATNPAMVAMIGHGYGLDNFTYGAIFTNQMLMFTAIAIAVMSMLLVARHTRSDEEHGRIELIRSLPTGRLSHLHATLLVAIGTNVILALLVGISLFALRIESMDLNGSLLYGAALGATGIFFAAITAIFAQLSENGRGTIGLSFAILIAAYLIRAIGDVSNETLSFISPLGLIMRSEAYVSNYWWPIIVIIIVSLAIMILAYYLNAIRDLEAGFIPAKPGKRHASRFLQTPFGLAVRLQRTALISWGIGIFVLGTAYGSVFGDLDSFIDSLDFIDQLILMDSEFSLAEQLLAVIMSVMAMFCTIPTLMVMNKLHGEEQHNRIEHLLGRAVSRYKLVSSYFITALLTSVIMLFLNALGFWSAASAVMDDPISFGTFFTAAFAYLPALWVMISISLLLIGMWPRATSANWLYLFYTFIVVYLGGLLQFPEWLAKITPFGYIPQYPTEEISVITLLILTAVAAILVILGFNRYRHRDIHG